MCTDNVTAGSSGGGGDCEWTVASSSECHRPTAVLCNTADAGCRNNRHVREKYATAVTRKLRLESTQRVQTSPMTVLCFMTFNCDTL